MVSSAAVCDARRLSSIRPCRRPRPMRSPPAYVQRARASRGAEAVGSPPRCLIQERSVPTERWGPRRHRPIARSLDKQAGCELRASSRSAPRCSTRAREGGPSRFSEGRPCGGLGGISPGAFKGGRVGGGAPRSGPTTGARVAQNLAPRCAVRSQIWISLLPTNQARDPQQLSFLVKSAAGGTHFRPTPSL